MPTSRAGRDDQSMAMGPATREATVVVDEPEDVPPSGTPRSGGRWLFPALPAVLAVALFYAVTVPAEPTLRWQRVQPPDGAVNPSSLVSVADRFAALSPPTAEGFVIWSSTDGINWTSAPVAGAPSHLTPARGDLLAVQGYGAARLVGDGDGWRQSGTVEFPELVRIGNGSGRVGVVGNGETLLVQTAGGDVLRSGGDGGFATVIGEPRWGPRTGVTLGDGCQPTSEDSTDAVPLLWADQRYLALVSVHPDNPIGVWPVCEPAVWESADGAAWERSTHGSPFGAGAFVYDVAWRDGVFVAVGGHGLARPAVWRSTDGLRWEEVEDPPSTGRYELREVAAGGLGWLVLGERADRPGLVGWVSPDGRCWDPLPDHVQGRIAAVADDRMVVIDRRAPVQSWLGVAGAGGLRCASG